MKSIFRVGFAGLALSLAAHANAAPAAEAWINSDARAMETRMGAFPLVQIGTEGSCFACKPKPKPASVKRQAEFAMQPSVNNDFQSSIRRMRAENAAMPQDAVASDI